MMKWSCCRKERRVVQPPSPLSRSTTSVKEPPVSLWVREERGCVVCNTRLHSQVGVTTNTPPPHTATTPMRDLPKWSLIHAASGGRRKRVLKLLAAGMDINLAGTYGMTALTVAALSNHPRVVEILVAAGANLNVQGYLLGDTPLHNAASSGFLEVTQILIAAGALLDVPNKRGETACQVAAINDHPAVVDALLAAGASPNNADATGSTILHDAAFWGHTGICMALLRAGASIGVQDSRGRTPVAVSALKNRRDTIRLMLMIGGPLRTTLRQLPTTPPKDWVTERWHTAEIAAEGWSFLAAVKRAGATDGRVPRLEWLATRVAAATAALGGDAAVAHQRTILPPCLREAVREWPEGS